MIGMTQDAFGELLDKLYYGALDTRDRGDKFERLMRSYLLTDQAYSFSKVWLWNEYRSGATARTSAWTWWGSVRTRARRWRSSASSRIRTR